MPLPVADLTPLDWDTNVAYPWHGSSPNLVALLPTGIRQWMAVWCVFDFSSGVNIKWLMWRSVSADTLGKVTLGTAKWVDFQGSLPTLPYPSFGIGDISIFPDGSIVAYSNGIGLSGGVTEWNLIAGTLDFNAATLGWNTPVAPNILDYIEFNTSRGPLFLVVNPTCLLMAQGPSPVGGGGAKETLVGTVHPISGAISSGLAVNPWFRFSSLFPAMTAVDSNTAYIAGVDTNTAIEFAYLLDVSGGGGSTPTATLQTYAPPSPPIQAMRTVDGPASGLSIYTPSNPIFGEVTGYEISGSQVSPGATVWHASSGVSINSSYSGNNAYSQPLGGWIGAGTVRLLGFSSSNPAILPFTQMPDGSPVLGTPVTFAWPGTFSAIVGGENPDTSLSLTLWYLVGSSVGGFDEFLWAGGMVSQGRWAIGGLALAP